MASIYQLKPAFQNLLRPLVQRLARWGITANQVTLFALLLSAALGAAIAIWPSYAWPLWCVPVLLFIRMALNAIDGMLAREHQMQSNLGAILNELGDVLADTALYLPFALIAGLNPIAVVLVCIFAIISEMTGVIGVQIGASRRYDGPMGKSDRAFIFGLIALLMAGGWLNPCWLNGGLWIVLGLLSLTIINRSRQALNELAQQGKA
ncbi:Inner membrane protein YnbA [Vibrio stylophorae]|uniref:Inner membrane protein YnbA n=1 Tax=Vibrio stylophorae TaxID=659351 RepID=A0ABM8ZQ78_9VIBR|nr:CDP-alcohol phosphatidyltransferase family protein [Vibrio stylophorae]CAH0532460.1 Inner membrane protein YnbA [Vibrio stylophorae]